MFWISEKETFVAAEEFGHDLEHVEVRIFWGRFSNPHPSGVICVSE